MCPHPSSGVIETSGLHLEWSEAPWDTAIFEYPVLQITRLEVRDEAAARKDFASFERSRDMLGSRLVSCRLAHEKLLESMLLEDAGFRFIEMLYRPELDLTAAREIDAGGLSLRIATPADLSRVLQIAGSAFGNERFHMDPRLPGELANRRYQVWAQSSLCHSSQRLFVLLDDDELVAFFVTEDLPDGTCYWHLNAVAPAHQGKGYGRGAWCAMIRHAKSSGAQRVRTSIVARNHRVLNLYARLGFRFPAPLMTFHWVCAS